MEHRQNRRVPDALRHLVSSTRLELNLPRFRRHYALLSEEVHDGKGKPAVPDEGIRDEKA